MCKLIELLPQKDFKTFFDIAEKYMKKHGYYIKRDEFIRDDFCERVGFYYEEEFMDISCKIDDDISFMDCCLFHEKLENSIKFCAHLESCDNSSPD